MNFIRRSVDLALVLGLCGLVFAAPLKWGLPLLASSPVFVPEGFVEWVLSAWPIEIFCLSVYALAALQALGMLLGTRPCLPSFLWPLGFASLFVLAAWLSPLYSAYVLFFFLLLCQRQAHAWMLHAFVAGAATVAAYAIFQRYAGLEQTAAWVRLYLYDRPDAAVLQAKLAGRRVFSTFVYPNSLGGYLIMALPVVLAWAWAGDMLRRCMGGVLLAMMLAALLFTGSQGSWAVLYILLNVLALRGMAGCTNVRSRLGLLLLWGAINAALFWACFTAQIFPVKWDTLIMRVGYWRAAWDMALSRWLLGYGPGTFGDIYPRFQLSWGGPTQMAHGDALQIFAETGIFGLIGWLGWWTGWVAMGRGGFISEGDLSRASGHPSKPAGEGIRGQLTVGPRAEDFERVRSGDQEREEIKPPTLSRSLIFLGLAAFLLHGLVDFDFFIPGITIPALLLLAMAWCQCLPGQAPGALIK